MLPLPPQTSHAPQGQPGRHMSGFPEIAVEFNSEEEAHRAFTNLLIKTVIHIPL